MAKAPATRKRIRVVLADDHALVRAGLRVLLEQTSDIQVVGEAGDGTEALHLVETQRPDVLLLDMEMPGPTGVEVLRQLRAMGTPVRVLVLSAYNDEGYIRGALAAGAAGYLLKDEAPQVVIEAVRGVARGAAGYFSPAVAAKLATWARGEETEGAELTEREWEVLRLMAKGWDNRQIAEALVISVGTVKNHVTNIYAKLGVGSRAEAVAWAWQHGVVRRRSGQGAKSQEA